MTTENFGQTVSPVIVNTIAPIAYANEARQIASDWTTSIHVPEPVENMLTVLLRPNGGGEPTHIFCSRNDYTHGLNSQLDFLATYDIEWLSSQLFQVDDNANNIKEKFCTIIGDRLTLLTNLNLEEC